MPTWTKVAVDAWTSAAPFAEGAVFRPVNRAGIMNTIGLREKVVWRLLQAYATPLVFLGSHGTTCAGPARSRVEPLARN
jgi:hypothetical protein